MGALHGGSHIAERVPAAEAGAERAGERLAACDESSPSPSAISVIVSGIGLLLFILDARLDDLLDVSNLDEDVFRFEIGMDDTALAVQVI